MAGTNVAVINNKYASGRLDLTKKLINYYQTFSKRKWLRKWLRKSKMRAESFFFYRKEHHSHDLYTQANKANDCNFYFRC